MTIIEELTIMNYSIIDCLKAKGLSIRKNELIKEILKDEACFFKMKKEEAYVVLKNLNVFDDMLKETYEELTSRKEFFRLYNTGKIDENDSDLIIKYDVYKSNSYKSEKPEIKEKDNLLIETKKESWHEMVIAFLKKVFNKN